MNAPPTAFTRPPPVATDDVDMLIVGAGISGIGMAVHLIEKCPGKTYAILERRDDLGGTWDLFKYPGIRSDSDMHTLGFEFEPWTHEKSIADGPAILEYLNRIVDERGVRPHIRFGSKVLAADWNSEAARWTVTIEANDGATRRLTAKFLYLGAGYYDYDDPYDAGFAGRDEFQGELIHPQFWPKDFDHAGKRIVVIGSGATAVTIVPAIAESAAHVTMLQRTPTWYAIRPAKDAFANNLRKFLPERWAYAITRFKNIAMQNMVFKKAREKPEKVAEFLSTKVREALGSRYDATAFTPPYNPWEQRLCLVPDADFFEAINLGKADVVTDHIERFDAHGIVLKSGRRLDADAIVTATGLNLAVAGKIAVTVDGTRVDFAQRFYYRNCMFSNVPNLAAIFGYLNASWTLRVDIVANYLTRVINHMDAVDADIAMPELRAGETLDEDNIFDFSSGYIQRALPIMPKSAVALPWRLNQDYLADRKSMRTAPIADGVLRFSKAHAVARAESELEAAE
ncbi:MAG TPA: NAD(P)/FAD-dependent oxidoreductase [Novosphingobium sp.]|nr:NAD(P)/FAD-dependent oxidoreductase [Novosphingobium sp.]